MKAILNTEVTFTSMVVAFDSQLNGNDEKTHNVVVKGHASHDYIWEKNKQESFEFGFFADKEFCDILQAYFEKKLRMRDPEQFPHDI